jgi:hypothetical protein
MMRRGSAGSNTTADHLQVLGDAIAALPPKFRRRLMVTDGWGRGQPRADHPPRSAGHPARAPADLLRRLGTGRPRTRRDPARPAGGLADRHRSARRGARAPDRCRLCGPVLRACAVLGRRSPRHRADRAAARRPSRRSAGRLAGDDAGFARRERPHPGAQLSLFETQDGWRYSLWVSNVQPRLRGWRAQLGYIDAAHRVHARVEDCIRTGKDCGIGRFPSHDFAMNCAWLAVALIAATLLSWLRLLALKRDLARAEPKTLPGPACRREAGPRRPPQAAEIPATWPWAEAIATAWARITALPHAP